MIKFTWAKLPVDADGKSYDSLESFQASEIAKLVKNACVLKTDSDVGTSALVAKEIVSHKAEIVEILELTTDARPTARGVRKPRKSKAEAQPELPKVA